VGRDAPEKGLEVLLAAWRRHAGVSASDTLGVVGAELGAEAGERVRALRPLAPSQLRDVYAGSDVLVVPSIATRTFREPWGLVVNEAMNTGMAVIASDAVGAAAGGLVRDGANGLVVPAGDADALAQALARLGADATLRERMGRVGAQDVLAYNHDAWAKGFAAALSSLGLARSRW
jgi:glycosyltransferase involved in cell wall biosynthesis